MQHAARACRCVGRQVAQAPLGGAAELAIRGLATATPADEVVDQMIAYARDHYRVSELGGPGLHWVCVLGLQVAQPSDGLVVQDSPDQVDDILKGGLAMDVSGLSQQR